METENKHRKIVDNLIEFGNFHRSNGLIHTKFGLIASIDTETIARRVEEGRRTYT